MGRREDWCSHGILVNSIAIWGGAAYAHHISLYPPNVLTFRRPWITYTHLCDKLHTSLLLPSHWENLNNLQVTGCHISFYLDVTSQLLIMFISSKICFFISVSKCLKLSQSASNCFNVSQSTTKPNQSKSKHGMNSNEVIWSLGPCVTPWLQAPDHYFIKHHHSSGSVITENAW